MTRLWGSYFRERSVTVRAAYAFRDWPPQPSLTAIKALFVTVYQPDQWGPWLTTPAPVFNGMTAQALIDSGRGNEVMAALDQIASGAFV